MKRSLFGKQRELFKRLMALIMCAVLLAGMVPESLTAAEPSEEVQAEKEALTDEEDADAAEIVVAEPDDEADPEDVVEEEPAGDPAEDSPYKLWVGKHAVTEANKGNIPGIQGGGSASFDPDTRTLKFTGTVTGVDGIYEKESSQIYSEGDLNIIGDATLPKAGINAVYAYYGNISVVGNMYAAALNGAFYALDGDIVINGDITAESWGWGALDGKNVVIKGGNIRLENHGEADGALRAHGKLIIEGGRLEATSTRDIGSVIEAGSDFEIADTHSITDPAGGKTKYEGGCYILTDSSGQGVKHVIIEQTAWDVWVGNQQVTKDNMGGIDCISGTVSFEPETNTLTFNDASITDSMGHVGRSTGVHLIYSTIPLKIRGKGKLKSTQDDVSIMCVNGADLDIQGEFVFDGGRVAIAVFDADVIISGENTDISITGADYGGIYTEEGKIEIREGKIEAECSGIGSGQAGPLLASKGIVLSKGCDIIEPAGGKLNNAKQRIVKPDGTETERAVIALKLYDLWVGATRVKSSNYENIPGIIGGGSAMYEPATKTLTFTGNVTGVTGVHETASSTYMIFSKGNLNIVGNATLTCESGSGICVINNSDFSQLGVLSVVGDIRVSSEREAIAATHSITLEGYIYADSKNGSAIWSEGGAIRLKEGVIKAVTAAAVPAICAASSDIIFDDNARVEAQSADGAAAVEAGGQINYDANEVLIAIPHPAKIIETEMTSRIITDGDENPASHVVVERKGYEIYVGDTQITYTNKDRINCGTGYADFNTETDTLTFHDATDISGRTSGAMIFSNQRLKISGKASLNAADTDDTVINVAVGNLELQGIFDLKGAKQIIICGGSLKISGDDTVISAKNSDDGVATILGEDGVVIEGGVVNAEGGATGIAAVNGDIELLGGEVNVESKVYAIRSVMGDIIDDGVIYFEPEGAHKEKIVATGTVIKDGSGNVAKKVHLRRSHIHPLTHVEALEATCEAIGYKEHWKCDTCAKFYEDQYGFTETTEEAVTIPAKGHTLVKHDRVEPTITADGMKEYWECSVCKKLFAEAEGKQEITDKSTLVIPMIMKYTVKESIKPEESITMKVVMTKSVSYNAMSHVLTSAKASKSKCNDIEILISGDFTDYATWKVSYKNNKIVPQKETKQPGVIIQLKAKKGATKDQKKAIKKANKYLKKNPVQFKIVQADIGSVPAKDVTVKLNKKKTKVTGVSIVMNGYKRKLATKDYEAVINANGTVTLTGKRYFTGQLTIAP